MIQYKCSDIVKRALQIADLENSSFISYDEEISLLNENYQALYQKMINADIQSFLKVYYSTDNIIPFPEDFYQLKSVCLQKDKYIQPILRRPEDQNFIDLSYEITGNILRIIGNFSGEIRIAYFPQPKTLTFPLPAGQTTNASFTDENGNAVNMSTVEDVVLDFPSSAAFIYLAYLLALAFCSKQGKDVSLILPLAQSAEQTFYETMTPDDWSSVRITNVYNV